MQHNEIKHLLHFEMKAGKEYTLKYFQYIWVTCIRQMQVFGVSELPSLKK